MVHDDISENALKQLKHVTLNVHAHIPKAIWNHLITNCQRLISLNFSKCEKLNDAALRNAIGKQSLNCLERFVIKGCHKEDVELTNQSVALLQQKFPSIVEIGDCFSWTISQKDYSVNEIRGLM